VDQSTPESTPDPQVAPIDISRPPKRLPVRTKSIWQTLPEPVREDIILREQEFDNAFKRYDGLGLYVIEAEKHGTSLQAALKSYAWLESVCRQDPCAGVDAMAQILSWNPKALAHAYAVRTG
jgi:hypothetical protein